MIDQQLVREAERELESLSCKLREIFLQADIHKRPPEIINELARYYVIGLTRGIIDFLIYCRSGE